MEAVCLVSGGIDSTFLLRRLAQLKYTLNPLFFNYGHNACKIERKTVSDICNGLNLSLEELDISDISRTRSGLTNLSISRTKDAYFPGRNLLFLTIACTYAVKNNIEVVAMGLVGGTSFPDQSVEFVKMATMAITKGLAKKIVILTPLIELNKLEVVRLAAKFSVTIGDTYSCYSGDEKPCNKCDSCMERNQILKLPEFVNNF